MFLALLMFGLVVLLLVVGLGLGIGWLVHWMVPGIDIGIGSVIGILAVLATGRFLAWATSQMGDVADDEELPDFLDDLGEVPILHVVTPAPWRRVRRRKRLRK
jgi:hypothetical protein